MESVDLYGEEKSSFIQSGIDKNATAIFPDNFLELEESTNWEAEGSDVSNGSEIKHEVDINDKVFSMGDVLKIIAYSKGLLQEKTEARKEVSVKMEKITPASVKTEGKSLIQNMSPDEKNCKQVNKKNYCVVSADSLKLLGTIQMSSASKRKNESLDSLYNIISDLGLDTLVKGQRKEPIVTTTNQLGYRRAFILMRRKVPDISLNQFLDDPTQYDAKTHTLQVPVQEDDIICFNSDTKALLKVIHAGFDATLVLSARQLIQSNQIVDAFHYIITQLRGNRQSDIVEAKERYDSYQEFDHTVLVGVAMNSLAILQQELVYATQTEMTEFQVIQKLHQCCFNDRRPNVTQAVLHCIGINFTATETAAYIVKVMEKLPIERQTMSTNKMNNMKTDIKSRVCFKWDRDGKCQWGDKCAFEHTNAATTMNNNSNQDDIGQKGINEGKLPGKQSEAGSKYFKQPFQVNLSAADRRIVGKPKGLVTFNNLDGWSRHQKVLIQNIIDSDEHTSEALDRHVNNDSRDNNYYTDHTVNYVSHANKYRSPDKIYEEYVNAFQESQQGTMRARIASISDVERSHYMNLFASNEGDTDHSGEVPVAEDPNYVMSDDKVYFHDMYASDDI